MGKIKETVKKNSFSLALIGLATAGLTTYTEVIKTQQQKRADTFEIFFSDYQDKIDCKLDSLTKKKCQ